MNFCKYYAMAITHDYENIKLNVFNIKCKINIVWSLNYDKV